MPRVALDKHQWLQLQEERRHARIVTVNEGMSVTPNLYFGTRRCTYSTVVSVVTTTLIQPRGSSGSSVPKSAWSAGATTTTPAAGSPVKFPSAATDPAVAAASYCFDSPYSALTAEALATTQAAGLAQERAAFMGKLRAARVDRFRVENHAALAIQRLYKGHVLRRRFHDMRHRLQMRKRIRSNLVRVTKGTAIVLGEKDRRARMLVQRNEAARRVQGAFRCWMARRHLVAERHKREWETRASAAVNIQAAWRAALARASAHKVELRRRQQARNVLARVVDRLYRGYMARQRVHALALRRQTIAAQRLQWFVQRHFAKKACALERQRRVLARCHIAAVAIQKHVRGMLQRARVIAMRLGEVQVVRDACALSIQRVVRGFLGRQTARYARVFARHTLAWACSVHLTRIVRGFLGRRRAEKEAHAQEFDLLVQARRGNIDAVVDLLDGFGLGGSAREGEDGGAGVVGADMTMLSENGGNSVLHFAAKFGHRELVALVLPKMREVAAHLVYARNRDGYSALGLAILHGHEQIALYILAMTAHDLFHSAASAHLTSGFSTRRERTLLHDAACRGLKLVSDKLMLLFPALLTGSERDTWTKRTPLHEALLLRRSLHDVEGSADELVAGVLETILSRSKQPATIIDAQDLVGFTALHMAAADGNLRAVRSLLQAGADVAVLDDQQRTAWRVALLQGHEDCFVEIRRQWLGGVGISGEPSFASREPSDLGGLSSSGSSVALVDAAARSRRAEHIHPQLECEALVAVEKDDATRLQFLVDEFLVRVNCREPDVEGSDGREDAGVTLLLRACESGAVNAVKFLLKHDELIVDLAGAQAKTPLEVAIASNHSEIANLLVCRGNADPLRRWSEDLSVERNLLQEAAARGFDTRTWLRAMRLQRDSAAAFPSIHTLP